MKRTKLKDLLDENVLGVLPSSKLMKMKWNPLKEGEPKDEEEEDDDDDQFSYAGEFGCDDDDNRAPVEDEDAAEQETERMAGHADDDYDNTDDDDDSEIEEEICPTCKRVVENKKKPAIAKEEKTPSLKSMLSEHILGELPSERLKKMRWNPITQSEPMNDISEKPINEEYVKSMGPDFDRGLDLIFDAWDYWKNAPETDQAKMIKPAAKEVISYINSQLKKKLK